MGCQCLEMLDEVACRAWWLRRLHPSGPICPQCGVSVAGRQAETWAAGGRVHCNDCGRWYNARTSTPLHNSTADFRQLYLLASLTNLACSVAQIAEACNLSTDSVRAWQHRMRGGTA